MQREHEQWIILHHGTSRFAHMMGALILLGRDACQVAPATGQGQGKDSWGASCQVNCACDTLT